MTELMEDLTPNPRILPMLGEINLAQWKCIAELVDNSIDAFLHAEHPPLEDGYQISVNLPMVDDESVRVSVRDNGEGMAPETLTKAVKAGWSGNDPIGSLGLFGMGFNIATARLGTVTTVWTTRREDQEWTGLRIDFTELVRQGHYRTPRMTRPKSDPAECGTEVVVERIKPEHRQWFAKAYNRSNLRKELGRAYSSMLRDGGDPIGFNLLVDGNRVLGQQHCVWSGDDGSGRVVQVGQESLSAVQAIDYRMSPRPYCTDCWQWLAAEDAVCPECGSADHLVDRERRIYGWVGIQRYLSSSFYGIDLVRNGRKIELLNRDLFTWESDGVVEEEYPIDDPRHRGRIVGEIHLDYCRVPYTKDRFDRTDPAWDQMVEAVRGRGPLRPDLARQLGFESNSSPLFRLFQAFRRSTPKSKTAGAWQRLLVVPDNDRATEMAQKYYAGESAYQSDQKWWDLVVEADEEILRGGQGSSSAEDDDELLVGGSETNPPASDDEGSPPQTTPAPVIAREPVPSLSRGYRESLLRNQWEVVGLRCSAGDPDLQNRPWRLLREASTGLWSFLFDNRHPIFDSYTLTPLDALLAELAHNAIDFATSDSSVDFASVLAALRAEYSSQTRLDPVDLTARAGLLLGDIARRFSGSAEPRDNEVYFNELTPSERELILANAASASPENPVAVSSLVEGGRFLEFGGGRMVLKFFSAHPELFFDGRHWTRSYSTLDFGNPTATDEARGSLLRYYQALLEDVVWLAGRDTTDLAAAPRGRLLRAALALDLLDTDVVSDS